MVKLKKSLVGGITGLAALVLIATTPPTVSSKKQNWYHADPYNSLSDSQLNSLKVSPSLSTMYPPRNAFERTLDRLNGYPNLAEPHHVENMSLYSNMTLKTRVMDLDGDRKADAVVYALGWNWPADWKEPIESESGILNRDPLVYNSRNGQPEKFPPMYVLTPLSTSYKMDNLEGFKESYNREVHSGLINIVLDNNLPGNEEWELSRLYSEKSFSELGKRLIDNKVIKSQN